MTRYHFDLIDSKTVADQGGHELSDDIMAMDVAEQLARRLLGERPELKNRHFSILVTNEDGEEVCRFPLDVIHSSEGQNMTNIKDKVVGKTKQVVAEVTGDGKLAEEGKQQAGKSDTEQKPFGNLDKLT